MSEEKPPEDQRPKTEEEEIGLGPPKKRNFRWIKRIFKSKFLLFIIIAILLIVIGVLVFYFFKGRTESQDSLKNVNGNNLTAITTAKMLNDIISKSGLDFKLYVEVTPFIEGDIKDIEEMQKYASKVRAVSLTAEIISSSTEKRWSSASQDTRKKMMELWAKFFAEFYTNAFIDVYIKKGESFIAQGEYNPETKKFDTFFKK